jgi:Fanconi anaemia group A protein N terminus
VLKILQDCKILKITDYLLTQTNEEDIQGIIADIIDLEESPHQLLREVITITRSSGVICTNFHQCFVQYTSDVINRPEVVKNEFITSIESLLEFEDFRDLIVRFMTELMSQEETEHINLTQVLSNQKDWNLKFGEARLKLVVKIVKQISINHTDAIVKILLKQINLEKKNCNWFFFLLIMRYVKQESKDVNDLKGKFLNFFEDSCLICLNLPVFLKFSFKKFLESNNADHLVMMLIIARQLYHYSNAPTNSYHTWVRSTIGEMNSTLKDAAKFTQTLDALQKIISYERDFDVVNIHAEIAIPSPRGTNHIVLEYKQLLKTRAAAWKIPEAIIDLS